ncbi:MAG TPA: aminotransferase class I/II-fold pyridoxal phosphate-dependent enzyme [Microbacteriaceae bacterium]|nr:aminotransferase class I/II-fold pyridoxal phosphate-dependent enzyme [Microbacteriaceae bacterium]HQX35672.1 aminotransferase class I/II-fold pyridoxal phosphate-dependent enzyme [Microbacteriaceae bacterium]HQZ47054.1 aminotransferase class I/II-fold pyridoxal phosphate-dependent enzyme [Microbacteriaceae bacterium]HRA09134.1 aminotransferase class I/II-fold pyridoxal phosphate-dependent enzyme [Microbacteriaceae bacterium]
MSALPLKALPIDQLRQRSSTKWRTHDADVLPLFVAETDFPLAPAISAVLARAVELGDTGYTPPQPGIREAYTAFAQRRFGWTVDPDRIRTTCDVMMGVVEVLRQVIKPGDRVITNPPVYPPFDMCIVEAGGVVDRVPLIDNGTGWELDLAGIEASFAAGARSILLCNPHNPTGTVHSRESLAALAEIAERFGATVVSDEIHSPSTQPGVTFTPFISASDAAARVGYVITSASKAFNLAGLKCALIITASDGPTQIVADLPPEVEWRTGLFGALAAVAAFAPESDEWLDSLLAALDENRRLLGELLEEHLPGARYRMPDAGFLAWVDLSALGWGDDPAERILTEAKVAFNQGPNFGPEGNGHVRINFGCSPEVLREAVERAGALLAK